MKKRDENKIAQIYTAALQLVVEMGIAGITMRDIAKRAGIATGTLYIYFEDKEKLIHSLYEECRSITIKNYFKNYEASLPFKTCFRVIWNNIFQHRISNFDVAVFMEQFLHSPFNSESTREMSRQLFSPLYKVIERGKEEAIFKNFDTKLMLIFMMGSVTELIKYLKYTNRKMTDDVIENAFTMCWDGLKITKKSL